MKMVHILGSSVIFTHCLA